MKICPNCNAQIPEDKKFCTECGTSMVNVAPQPVQQPVYTPPVQQPVYTQPVQPQPVYTQPAGDFEPDKDSKYAPVSTKSFLGMMLLMFIPVIGWLLLIVWALTAKKVNKRNMARASLIMTVIVLVLSIALGMLAKSFAVKVVEKAKVEAQAMIAQQIGGDALAGALNGEEGGTGGILGLFGGLLGGNDGNILGGLLGGEDSGLGALGGLLGQEFSAEELEELEEFLGQLQQQNKNSGDE